MKRKLLILPATLAAIITMGASSCNNATPTNSAEQSAQADIQGNLTQAQPLPQLKWSQYRETLIDVEIAQANTVQTTTFAFNMGVADPVWSCPSIGFPLASTTSLSNPQQVVQGGGSSSANYWGGTVGQMDPNGVYSGQSSGTYVVCVAPDGTNSIHYWEGFVDTVTGPAVWDNHQVKLTGPSTVTVKTKK